MPKRRDPAIPSPFHFDGFDSPNTTPVPDVLFDLLAPELTEAELRVLLYIIRRTYGFKKRSDDISLKQLVEGIHTSDGRVLDRGAGVAKSAAARAVKGLIEKGIIIATRNRSLEKGDEPTTYTLHFKDGGLAQALSDASPDPVSSKRTRGGPPKEHARVLQENPQETVKHETVLHNSNIRDATHDGFGVAENGAGEEVTASEPVALGESLKCHGQPSGTSEDREVIVSYLADFAREMNDQASLRVSVTRALNLMTRSGLPREAFIQKLYEARSLTKEHAAGIRTKVKIDGAPVPVKAKMAYFFAVLEDLLGLKDEPGAPAPQAEHGS